ncbi:MAG TPA: hypothetical protein VM681_00835 [Candidatus Thermoplasmatota archaeon]|nr:hypothetical protein [Candidatus Thermoplasmatota archaeon]
MSRRFLRGRRAKAAALLCASAAALAALLAPVVAQSGATELDLDNANCFGHHAADVPPFKTTVHIVPDTLIQVPASGSFVYAVTITNAWKHEMLNTRVGLNLTRMPNVAFAGDEVPYQTTEQGTLPAGATSAPFEFPVGINATAIVVTLEGDPGPLSLNDFDLRVVAPSGRAFLGAADDSTTGLGGGNPASDRVEIDTATIQTEAGSTTGSVAAWNAFVTFAGGTTPQGGFSITIDVAYDITRNPVRFAAGPARLAPGESATFEFELAAGAVASGQLGIQAIGTAFYNHNDPQAVDFGNYSKSASVPFAIGTETLHAQALAGPGVAFLDPAQRVMRQWGFLLGFTGFFLVFPSLVLGGAFGTQSVRVMNRFSGSARQRVLWHNALSYVLLGIGVTHASLFLVETTYQWSVGLVWGGLTLAAFLGLAVTGALQTRLVKTYGYAAWRFSHFSMGFLALFFVILHVVVDGVDFQWLRDLMR